jgi:hypothetical protein
VITDESGYRPSRVPIESEPLGFLGTAGNEALLLGALAEAGVTLTPFERRRLTWLAGSEFSTAAVIASWIVRAHTAGESQ